MGVGQVRQLPDGDPAAPRRRSRHPPSHRKSCGQHWRTAMPYVKGVRGAVPEDLTGRIFERLTVVGMDRTRGGRTRWFCRCSCGSMKSVTACELKAGNTKSCGCFDADRKKTTTVRHGFSRTPTYVCWSNMHARCSNQSRPDFARYGGRGICVCDHWSDFATFLADMGEKPLGLTLDRIDNNGNYEPGNCRWATPSEQRRNQRSKSEIRAAAEIGRTMK